MTIPRYHQDRLRAIRESIRGADRSAAAMAQRIQDKARRGEPITEAQREFVRGVLARTSPPKDHEDDDHEQT